MEGLVAARCVGPGSQAAATGGSGGALGGRRARCWVGGGRCSSPGAVGGLGKPVRAGAGWGTASGRPGEESRVLTEISRRKRWQRLLLTWETIR